MVCRVHRLRKPPGHPDMSGRPRGATQTPGIVQLFRGGSNYSLQAVGTSLDSLTGRPEGPTLVFTTPMVVSFHFTARIPVFLVII